MTASESIKERILKTGMLDGYDRVIAAVSGGADSVFLFYVLFELLGGRSDDNERLPGQTDVSAGPSLEVVHVHHGIRGGEADRDADFVREMCRKHGVPFKLIKRDIPKEAADKGMTLEEAGRAARYEIFAEEAFKGHCAVALAHHLDDQAETLLFRLARGTGLAGLSGMREKRDHYIRPLLGISRADIEKELNLRGIIWVEDSTNAGEDAARNRIRHSVLPLLRTSVNSRAAEHIAGCAGMLAEAGDFILAEAEKRASLYLESQTGSHVLILCALLDEMPVMRTEVIRIACKRILGAEEWKDFGRGHIEAVLDLFMRSRGKRLDLPSGVSAERTSKGVLLGRKGQKEQEREESGRIFLKEVGGAPSPVPENRYTKWFDYGKMNSEPLVRTRLPGDYLTINAEGGRKSLSDYFTDEKIPVNERDRILLLVDGSEVIWVTGMRIGYRYRITDETKRVLQADWKPAEMGPAVD